MALDDDIALLESVPLFGHLESDALRLLAFAAEHIELEADQILFSYGDRSDGGYVVRKGEILIQAPNQKEFLTVGANALIGQIALFTRNERPATAIARVESSLIRISSNLMKRCLEEYPSGAHAIYSILAQDLKSLTRSMMRIGDTYLQ